MLLFKPENAEKILSGRKTQTRRTWKKSRVQPGSTHRCVTRLFGEPFATVRVIRVWQEPWDAISEDDAVAEGFENRDEFLRAFQVINGVMPAGALVFAVDFRLVDGSA